MEAESSLPFSQVPATGSYPDEDESVPHAFALTICNLIFCRLRLDLPSGFFP